MTTFDGPPAGEICRGRGRSCTALVQEHLWTSLRVSYMSFSIGTHCRTFVSHLDVRQSVDNESNIEDVPRVM